jgi:phosphoribosylaminoimidazole carboxylase (NCAIR synthetase)
MTASQRCAIEAIADRLGINARSEARDIIGAEFETLTVRQASELIDHLKAQQQPATTRR